MTMRETIFGAKLKTAGVHPRNVKLQIALAEFQNNGGEYGVALAMLNAAYGKGSGGQSSPASDGQVPHADASRTNEGEGQSSDADNAGLKFPDPSPQRNGAGQVAHADKATLPMPRPVSPSYITAAKSGAKSVAITVLDSFKVRDGRSLGDVRFGELESLRFENAREASIIRQIQKHCTADANAKVRDIINTDTLQRMIQRAAEVADVA